MKKIVHIILKIVLALIMLIPILGIFGIFPEPSREMYNTDVAFNFINLLSEVKYINYIMAIVFGASIILLFMGREAFAALLIAPITVNIIGFHLFLDGGLFTGGAILGNALLVLNIYFLYKNREKYEGLWEKADK